MSKELEEELEEEKVEDEEEKEAEETEEVEADSDESSTADVKNVDSDEDETEEVEEEDKTVPYSRFKEKVDEVNKLKAELDELKNGSVQQDEADSVEEVETHEPQTNDEPLRLKLDQYEAVFNQMLSSKLELVPDEYHELIPDVDNLEKLTWIENALNKGLFNKKAQSFGNLGANPTEQDQEDNSRFIRSLGRKF